MKIASKPRLIAAWAAWDFGVMPDFLRGFLRSFAAMAFQASDFHGLLAFLAFFLSSPLGGMMAVAGYLGGAGARGARFPWRSAGDSFSHSAMACL